YRPTDTKDAPWQMWASRPIDETGKYELCYRSPQAGFAGILQMQIIAVGPDGEQTAAYAPDNLVVVPSMASCTESAKLCCDPNAAQPPAAGAAAAGAAGAAAAGSAATSDMGAAGTGSLTQAATMPTQAAAPASSGCSCAARSAGADLCGAGIMLLMAACVRLRLRLRLRRTLVRRAR
ncbi:MAG TPA: hypothetical protein VMF89_29185, partial [Polyangiales bacterium]|nr:hypothetical protein [Polyangiales bacterium]